MLEHSCCSARTIPRRGVRRVLVTSRWVVPTAILALMPKCPMCLAAYIALMGITVSLSAAAWLRFGLVMACVGMLIGLSIKLIARGMGLRRASLTHANGVQSA